MAEIRALINEVLGTDVPGDGSFIGHGGDSFHAVLIVAQIEERWGVEVDFLDVLDSTPDTLTTAVNIARGARAQG
ncbi:MULTISPECIES: acyl carrier protein [Streptomyces]|uniref:acyl carrier protein n=1 Tax=Streptomyces TaxID=1883 RepID=UPI00163BF75C|nr:acyl carrier protein [Streptomyces sp. WAC01280]